MLVQELWESQADHQRWYDQTIKPEMQSMGIPEPRTTGHDAHNYLQAKR
jgi:hypothetical protein